MDLSLDLLFLADTFLRLLTGVPLTLQLAASSVALGAVLALLLAAMRRSGLRWLDWPARFYIFVFRGTPLLVQLFLIYYGLSQFREIRTSFLWPVLRDPTWCAVIALTLNTAAYGGEIIRGGLASVQRGQMEAARAAGMGRWLLLRRVVLPLALRQALPAYGNELILMVKATSLASIITLMEITGIAAKLIAQSYRTVEVFAVAGAIYLVINFVLTRLVHALERRLDPGRPPALAAAIGKGGTA
ncbi:Octopine transport system permease protein occM [Roseomonas mucosa]|jgi:octopine/nopaline transport system permease protein|uniref:ABC transporter permease n=1 Tax=Roseomonas TaxID=125216 RepID=UPI000C17ACE8|nr:MULTISPECIES: ABC transporter permease subunit [Roseomonas]ATR21858.1 ABC transporter permease [Roseomonas sp. FDAARGOS_362]MDT8266135.1 ABC transporter permease subunit [Roseomonas sp. DSM 102946]UZO95684.1 Octopine transport system permease protein occM [Roseomonas mucosa]